MAHLFSRNNLNWSNSFPEVLNALEKLKLQDAILDGELVFLNDQGKADFQKLQNTLKTKKDKKIQYYIFDLLYLNGMDLRDLTLLERKKRLKKLISKNSSKLSYSEHLFIDGQDFFRTACEHNLEGIVSKQVQSPYQSGRNTLWLKTKCTKRQEFVIGGWSEAKGSRYGFGSLLLGVYEGNHLRFVGKVGSGFSSQALKDLKKEFKKLESSKSPFEVNSPPEKNNHWLKPKKICEVSFAEWTSGGYLRVPIFKGLREDKSPKDISMDNEISSPDKILYKKEKITKSDVADYYQKIAKWILPQLSHRPLSLVRCPRGTSHKCFFQKHFVGDLPSSFHTFPIKENSGEGIYLSIDSVEGLLELVQLNAFEIHAWNCSRENYQRPNQIVMDLDPGPGVLWKDVVDAAFELKEMFEGLNLKSFVKLTGGKGLHIHVPIMPIYTWDQIKSFAESIALEMASRDPGSYVVNMSKRLRRKKIFIDYLRNGYGATAVVPYSLRAKELSAVALPLDWKELRRVKSSSFYTLSKALRKVKTRKSDPWAGMKRLNQKISILKEHKN